MASLWDLSSQVTKWSVNMGDSVTQVQVSGDTVYCGTGEGLVRGVDTRSGAAVCELSGHKSAVLDLAVTDTMAVTTSDDGTARVWDLRVNR